MPESRRHAMNMPGAPGNLSTQDLAFLGKASDIAENQISKRESLDLYDRFCEAEGISSMDPRKQSMTAAALLVSMLRICALKNLGDLSNEEILSMVEGMDKECSLKEG
jgi:hypothetical protein